MTAADIYTPEPNILERRIAARLARQCPKGSGDPPSPERVRRITRVTKWVIGLSALAGIVSGGMIGGAEVWMRHAIFDGMEDDGWRETLPYWAAFYAFVGVVSAVEIFALYALALTGIARVTRHSGLPLSHENGGGLFAYSLARAALEFPNPQVLIYGIDPYARVANWKLAALNIAYKLKVGASSFILRVFLRRVAARVAIRGMVPLIAGPLYALWNAYIAWRVMTEARVRTLGPFAVDTLIATHFQDAGALAETEKNVILHAAGEMLTRGRDAHPNQIYLISGLRMALECSEDITLDWTDRRGDLHALNAAGQTRVLDLLTLSCVIGARIHSEQTELLRSACQDCGATLHENRLKALRKSLESGCELSVDDLSATRGDAHSSSA